MKFVLLAATLLGIAQSRCQEGQIPNKDQLCIKPKYIQGCYQYATTETCSECQFHYKIRPDGRCQYLTTPTNQCCLEKDTNNRCTKCNLGLSLQNGICKVNTIIGCLQKSAQGKCLNCAQGFSMQMGTCKKGINNCKRYMDNTNKVCTLCTSNHSLINNACLQNKILGCLKQSNNQCQECYEPFTLKSGHCQISQCRSYNDFGCTACNCGFFLQLNRTCSEMGVGCLRYQRGLCVDCMPGFKLKGDHCEIDGCQKNSENLCLKCNEKFELKDGMCLMKNCLEWNNGRCEICQQKFFYKDGKCIEVEITTNLSKS